MHKIIITSTQFSGSLEFEMDYDEIVKRFENKAELDEKGLTWLSSHFPMKLSHLNEMLAKSTTLSAELVQDLTFERFWEEYGMKRNKERAKRFWKKLSDADRLQALKNINPYHHYLQVNPGQPQMYPDTYLNPVERKFENDYSVGRRK